MRKKEMAAGSREERDGTAERTRGERRNQRRSPPGAGVELVKARGGSFELNVVDGWPEKLGR